MKSSILALFISILSFSTFSAELSLVKQCIESKSTFENLNVDVLTWKPIKTSEDIFPVLKVWEQSIPIVPNQSPKVGIFNDSFSKRLALMNFESQILQTIEANTYHSQAIKENLLYPILIGDNAFSALMKSFSIKLSDLDCDAFRLKETEPELFLLNSKKLALLLLKANYKTDKVTGVIKQPAGFIITSEIGFEYHSIKNNVSTVTNVFTKNPNDVYTFINTLNQPVEIFFNNEILNKIVSVWDNDSPLAWRELLSYLKSVDAPQETLDSVSEVADNLTRN
ncbi:MAG: hypothetical protein ACJAUY_002098 [Cognaticolwellia sp.]|jgi:hypothetical protein